MTNLTSADLDVLTQWDTPTICNALEITNPERRSFGYNVKPLTCLDPSLPPMIGYARTAKIRAAAPATVSADLLRTR